MGSSDGHYFLDNGNICPSQLTIAVHQFPSRQMAGILHLWECRIKVLPKRLADLPGPGMMHHSLAARIPSRHS